MTPREFDAVVKFIGLAVGKTLSAEAQVVYFELLEDVPYATMQTAAKRALLAHKWPTFPTIAELRTAAAETQQGQVNALTSAEAWRLAWGAVARIDPELDFDVKREFAKLPRLVVETIRSMGLPALCYGKEPVAVVRSQFMKMFEQLATRDKQLALLPATVKEAIAAGPDQRAEVRAIAGKIGNPTEGSK